MAAGDYTLDPIVAAGLRRPLVAYPGGVVPVGVIRATVVDEGTGFTAENYPQLGEAMRIDALLDLVQQHTQRRDK